MCPAKGPSVCFEKPQNVVLLLYCSFAHGISASASNAHDGGLWRPERTQGGHEDICVLIYFDWSGLDRRLPLPACGDAPGLPGKSIIAVT